VSFLRRLSRRAPPGGLILPRSVANRGVSNWPKCARCGRDVDAYGLENETDHHIEVWARCDGILRDPRTGDAVWEMTRMHEPMKTSVTVNKGSGWSHNRLTDIISRLAFFAPTEVSEGREFYQGISGEGVRKRHTV
jgi:hypothetical protein